MRAKNTSDMIEQHLKKLLEVSREIEIKRSELAETFDVVPSQINYVIKTRFTMPKGYEVVSKRGGGGYIKIVKIQYSDSHSLIQDIYEKVPDNLTETVAKDIIHFLNEEKLITLREKSIILSMFEEVNFYKQDAAFIRSNMMRSFLQRMDREDGIR